MLNLLLYTDKKSRNWLRIQNIEYKGKASNEPTNISVQEAGLANRSLINIKLLFKGQAGIKEEDVV